MIGTVENRVRPYAAAKLLGAASLAAVSLALAAPASAQSGSGPNDAAPGVQAGAGASAGQQAQTVGNGETTGAAEQVTTTEAAADEDDAIVVTGFRSSLESALNLKRNAVGSVDAIVAEDIAKFPDQNLAESLDVATVSSPLTRTRVNWAPRPRTVIARPSPPSRWIEMPGTRCSDSARF